MKTIVAGGRDHRLSPDELAKLDSLADISELVSGGADGVDADAEAWALAHKIPITRFKPNWSAYGKAAGPIRNREMAKYADAVVLYPGGRGTQSMYKEAVKENLVIYDFRKTPDK
jgi:hypothetical protein